MRIKSVLCWGGALFIAGVFLDSLRFKFTGHETPRHIFTTLADWSGIGLFYPAGPWIIGIAELAAAVLLVALPLLAASQGRHVLGQASQLAGAALALGVMSGAILFHLFTPLGIRTPTAWADGAVTAEGSALFVAACACWVLAAMIIVLRRDALAALPLRLGRGRAMVTSERDPVRRAGQAVGQ